MKTVLSRIANELVEARKKDDIRRINCLTAKFNLVKGLIQASERAQMSLTEAFAHQDDVNVQAYRQKINTYGDGVDEVGKTLSECLPGQELPEGMASVYIRPEEPELEIEEAAPWETDETVGGGEGYPVVPPTSPFR